MANQHRQITRSMVSGGSADTDGANQRLGQGHEAIGAIDRCDAVLSGYLGTEEQGEHSSMSCVQ